MNGQNFPLLLSILLNCCIFMILTEVVFCYKYPLFGTQRYLRTVPIRRSAYIPISIPRHISEYQLPDYDDGYVTTPQDEYEYSPYDKYPFVQYLGYYPSRDYYREKAARRSPDVGYFDEAITQDTLDAISDDMGKGDGYPYGQETWYEEELPRYDSNAEANAAFLQDLIMAQMYQDARNQYPMGYDSTADDYDDQHWFYGVPTTEVEDKEKVKQYFKNKEDEEVRELESLARKKEKSKKLKEKDPFSKQRKTEKQGKQKSKMSDDEYFDMQKQIVVNSRKNRLMPVGENLQLSKKQVYNPVDVKNNFWDFHQPRSNSHMEAATNSIKKLNLIKDGKTSKGAESSSSQIKVEATAPTSTTTSTASPKRPPTAGQKEVVLPRPSNPVRRPFPDVSTRSLHQPSVYDTIKKLLNMEKDIQKRDAQPQKRFVLNEDQLIAELNGLKKISA